MSSVNPIASAIEKAKELDQLRREQEKVIGDINKIHKKLKSKPNVIEKSGDDILTKLRDHYVHAKELAENEASVAEELLGLLDEMKSS